MDEQRDPLAAFSAKMNAIGEAFQQAMADFAANWPPERIIASAIGEYNRRMDEINRR